MRKTQWEFLCNNLQFTLFNNYYWFNHKCKNSGLPVCSIDSQPPFIFLPRENRKIIVLSKTNSLHVIPLFLYSSGKYVKRWGRVIVRKGYLCPSPHVSLITMYLWQTLKLTKTHDWEQLPGAWKGDEKGKGLTSPFLGGIVNSMYPWGMYCWL